MEELTSRKEIRSLLNIGSQIQKFIDSLGPLGGNLFQLSGGSNSGKSKLTALLVETLSRDGRKCAFFDIENSGLYARGFNRFDSNSNVKIFFSNTESEFLCDLDECKKEKVDVITVDYLNLIEDLEMRTIADKLKSMALDNNLFILVAMHTRKTSSQTHENFELIADFSAIVEKSGSEIFLTLKKRKSSNSEEGWLF